MSNLMQKKATAISKILAEHDLIKQAEEKITHPDLRGGQTSLGAEQTKDLNEFNAGGAPLASTEAGIKGISDKAKNEAASLNDLNQPAEDALAAEGTTVDTMTESGRDSANFPEVAEKMNAKVAAFRHRLNTLVGSHVNGIKKQAAIDPRAVMRKIATLDEQSTDADFAQVSNAIKHIAATDPDFAQIKVACVQEIMARDCEELAAAYNIPMKKAAELLDAAAAANPEMLQEVDDAATVDAVDELAGIEEEADAISAGVDELAANASSVLGVEVTPEVIVDSIEQVVADADARGVPPEALLQEAMDMMVGDADVTPEDEAMAEQIMAEAEAAGIPPEAVLEELVGGGAIGGGEGGGDEELAAIFDEAAAAGITPEELIAEMEAIEAEGAGGTPKEASFRFNSPRAQFVSNLLQRG
jgi:hypothetical protein